MGIKVNENWRNQYNKELMQLFGDLHIFICEKKSVELDWSW